MKTNEKKTIGIVLGIGMAVFSGCQDEDPITHRAPPPTVAPSIEGVRYPATVRAGEMVEVTWRVKGLSEQAAHRLLWSASATPDESNPVGATVLGGQAFSASFIAPSNSSAVSFIIDAQDYDGRGVKSNQYAIMISAALPDPSVTILEAPTQVSANETISIRWRFDGTAMLTSNVIRWGTSPAQYDQNSLGGRLVAGGEYIDDFAAPNGVEKIYFIVQVVDASGVYVSAEGSISVASTMASVTVDAYPMAVVASGTIEVRWTVNNADTLIENRVFWGSQSGQLNSVSPTGIPTGNNSYVAEFVAPSISGTVYFVVRASDQSGAFSSSEITTQITAGPAVTLDALPQRVVTATTVDVRWAVTGVSNISSTILEWGTTSGVYDQTVSGVLTGQRFEASLLAPADASQTIYLRAVAFHDQGRTESVEHSIQLFPAPTITIESAPTAAQTNADIEIVWNYVDAVNVTANVIRFGDAPGVYTNEVAVTETLAANRFRAVFSAPSAPQVVYFVAQITDSNGRFQSQEQSISVGGAPSIDIIRIPLLISTSQPIEVVWQLNNMSGVTQNEVRWGPFPGVFLNTVSNVQSLGNNQYSVRFLAPSSGTLVSLRVYATDSQGAHRSSTKTILLISQPTIHFAALPRAWQSGQPMPLTWTVSNVSNIDRQYITWGNTSGQLSNQTADAIVNGGNYTATIPVPAQFGTLYFAVHIVSQGTTQSFRELMVEIVPGQPVSLPDTQSAVSIMQGEHHYYSFPVTQGIRYEVTMTPQASGGDIDLYVSENVQISTTNYACRPYNGGTQQELCSFVAAADGYAHILINGFAAGGYDLATVQR
jgi:hypothetical protein